MPQIRRFSLCGSSIKNIFGALEDCQAAPKKSVGQRPVIFDQLYQPSEPVQEQPKMVWYRRADEKTASSDPGCYVQEQLRRAAFADRHGHFISGEIEGARLVNLQFERFHLFGRKALG